MPVWLAKCDLRNKLNNNMSGKQQRINWLLILQGWAMLWVVIGHAFLGEAGQGPCWENELTSFAYSFHMPLFMLVSGWLFYMTRLNKTSTNLTVEDTLNCVGQEVYEKRWTYSSIIKDKALRILLPGLVFSLIALVIKLAVPGEVTRQAGFSLKEILMSYIYPFNNPFRELWFIVALFWMFVMTNIMAMGNKKNMDDVVCCSSTFSFALLSPSIHFIVV